jgi:hypothetical protein
MSLFLANNQLRVNISRTYRWQILGHIRLQGEPVFRAEMVSASDENLIFESGLVVSGVGATPHDAMNDLANELRREQALGVRKIYMLAAGGVRYGLPVIKLEGDLEMDIVLPNLT